MELHLAIREAVKTFGKNILLEDRLIGILKDYAAFEEKKAAQYVIESMIKGNYMHKLIAISLDSTTWQSELLSIRYSFIDNFGYRDTLVDYVFCCIFYSQSLTTKVLYEESCINLVDFILNNIRNKSVEGIESNSLQEINLISSNEIQFGIGNKYLPKSFIRKIWEERSKRLIVPNGIEVINSKAFYTAIFIEEVILPNSIITIEEDAFCNCRKLKYLNLSNKLTEIQSHAFSGCTSLTDIRLPQSMRKIGYGAFYMSGIKSLFLPQNVSMVGYSYGIDIDVDDNNVYFKKINGTIYSNDLTQIICVSPKLGYKKFVVPETVNKIGTYAFANNYCLLDIILPVRLERIEGFAFSKCKQLSGIIIPSSVKYIDWSCFEDCDNLTEVVFLHHNLNCLRIIMNYWRIKKNNCTIVVQSSAFKEALEKKEFEGFKRIKIIGDV